MNSTQEHTFIDTMEYRRFLEFCNACREYRYIGLCYGPPGVGKTLSARHYANWDKVESYSRINIGGVKLCEVLHSNIVFYTVPVLNTPNTVQQGIHAGRKVLHNFLMEDIDRKHCNLIDQTRQFEKNEEDEMLAARKWDIDRHRATAQIMAELRQELYIEHSLQRKNTKDPTVLVVIDEADRLKMSCLEQVRDLFDKGEFGLVLIGMPGLEKRLARYPQLYSRVGFVHEYRPLSQDSIRQLLHDRWCPSGIRFPNNALSDNEGVNAIIRATGGNFRLLHRLLTQVGRVLEINGLELVTTEVVDAARESLVIGTA